MANPIDQYDGIFKAAGAEWNVDPVVLKALALHESGGDPNAGKNTSVGGQGLMQIVPGTQGQLGVTAPFDPQQSIYGGAKYLAMALDAEHDNPAAALRYYNGGPGWRTNPAADPKYANSVAAQYVKLAKADTGTLTDAPPAPPGASPAATAQADAPDYNNPPAGASAKPAAAAPDAYDAALKGKDASGGKAAEPDAYTKALADPALQVTTKPPPDDFGTFSPEGVYVPPGAIPAKGAPVASLEDLRDRIQQGEINALKWMAPDKDAGPIERGLRYAAMTGTHLAAGIAQAPLNALVFAEQGGPGPGGLTYNPQTGAMNLTPEAMAAASLGANPLRFGGALKPQLGPWPAPEQFGPPTPEPFGPPTAPTPAFVPPNTSNVPLPPRVPPRAPPTDTRPAMIPPNTTVDPVTGEVTPVQQPPTAAGGGPQPGGAQITPSYEAIHTPAEEAAYRATAEGKKLLEPQIIGEPDRNQYIPGETVNSAEQEQTVKAARELKELGIRVPEASQMDKAAAESNNTARTIYAENTAKTPTDIYNRGVQRQADIEADKATVFAPDNVTGPVDLRPVIQHMQDFLNRPFNIENTALQQAYKPWLERLQGFADGKIDNPEQAWGLRYDIDQQTDKLAQRDQPNMRRIGGALDDAAGVLDKQIEKAAPGYADMLARYKEHSRAIDEMTVLQGALKNLRGPGQTLTYNDFQRFMKNVVDSRMTRSTDINPYKAISQENMQRLWNIRDSLRRTASAKELARAAGSDTMPNIIDSLKAIGKMGGVGAVHAYVGAHLGPAGNVALQSLGAIGKGLNDRRMIRKATRQMNELLYPSTPLRVPPGQENPLTGAPPP